MAKLLWTIREHRELPASTWDQFKQKAAANGYSPSAALTRLIKRYLARGFDDGQPERTGPTDT
jgi:hypothetical protein